MKDRCTYSNPTTSNIYILNKINTDTATMHILAGVIKTGDPSMQLNCMNSSSIVKIPIVVSLPYTVLIKH